MQCYGNGFGVKFAFIGFQDKPMQARRKCAGFEGNRIAIDLLHTNQFTIDIQADFGVPGVILKSKLNVPGGRVA